MIPSLGSLLTADKTVGLPDAGGVCALRKLLGVTCTRGAQLLKMPYREEHQHYDHLGSLL